MLRYLLTACHGEVKFAKNLMLCHIMRCADRIIAYSRTGTTTRTVVKCRWQWRTTEILGRQWKKHLCMHFAQVVVSAAFSQAFIIKSSFLVVGSKILRSAHTKVVRFAFIGRIVVSCISWSSLLHLFSAFLPLRNSRWSSEGCKQVCQVGTEAASTPQIESIFKME